MSATADPKHRTRMAPAEDKPRSYSPFLPILIVLVMLSLVYSVQLVGVLSQRSQVKSQLAASEQVMPQASEVNAMMSGFSRELLELAPKSPGARAIVREFNIQSVDRTAPQAAKQANKPTQ